MPSKPDVAPDKGLAFLAMVKELRAERKKMADGSIEASPRLTQDGDEECVFERGSEGMVLGA